MQTLRSRRFLSFVVSLLAVLAGTLLCALLKLDPTAPLAAISTIASMAILGGNFHDASVRKAAVAADQCAPVEGERAA